MSVTGIYYSTGRSIELSTIYYLETSIATDWTNVTVVKSFNSAYKNDLPVIAIYLSDVNNDYREIGSTTLLNDYTISIDIFAESDGQRIDLGEYVVDKLKDSWVYYIHAQQSGSPETLTRTADGRIFVHDFIDNSKVDLGTDVDRFDKFRTHISIQVRKSES